MPHRPRWTTSAALCSRTCKLRKLTCSGSCELDTSGCVNPEEINYNGPAGPDFSADGCWQQCAGYLDNNGGDDIPSFWGQNCTSQDYDRVRIACGTGPNSYRYIQIEKNHFKDLMNAYPEVNMISEAKNQDGVDFTINNQIYAQGNNPNTAVSWWNGGNGCGELNTNLTVNNICSWEASNCFGQNIGGSRYLYVYVAP